MAKAEESKAKKESVESWAIHFGSSKKDTSNRNSHNNNNNMDTGSKSAPEGKSTTLSRRQANNRSMVKVMAPVSLSTVKTATYALAYHNAHDD
jgi:hypothetical protein